VNHKATRREGKRRDARWGKPGYEPERKETGFPDRGGKENKQLLRKRLSGILQCFSRREKGGGVAGGGGRTSKRMSECIRHRRKKKGLNKEPKVQNRGLARPPFFQLAESDEETSGGKGPTKGKKEGK